MVLDSIFKERARIEEEGKGKEKRKGDRAFCEEQSVWATRFSLQRRNSFPSHSLSLALSPSLSPCFLSSPVSSLHFSQIPPEHTQRTRLEAAMSRLGGAWTLAR